MDDSAEAPAELDLEAVRRALAGRVVGGRILYMRTVDSTMDEVRRAAEGGATEGLVVMAEEQRAGRGRFRRKWVSPPGQNLALSLLLRPPTEGLRYVNMATCLAVAQAVAHVTGLEPTLKWPNDVRLSGRKLAGVLMETAMDRGRLRYAVVGVGINVNMDPSDHPEIAAIATSLLRETGRRWPRGLVLRAFLERMDALYGRVLGGESLTREWAAALETLGRRVAVRWKDAVVEGVARSVDEEGNLLLERDDGSVVPVMAGEVTSQL